MPIVPRPFVRCTPCVVGNNIRVRQVISHRKVATRATQNETSESLQMLQSFFIGRALAEVANERLGSILGDVVVNASKVPTELQRFFEEFQQEVLNRAENEMIAASGSSSYSLMLPASKTNIKGGRGGGGGGSNTAIGLGSSTSTQPMSPDVAECVDNLRAEVALARSIVQKIKQNPSLLD